MHHAPRRATPPTCQHAVALAVLLHAVPQAHAQATPPGPMTWTYGYDAEGNLKTVTNPNGHVTDHTYDGLQRRRTTTQPLPAPLGTRPVIQMDYDGRDQLSRVVDPRSLPTTYTTDGLGNTSAQQSPDSGSTTATYDAAGNLQTRTDARGITHTYSYDALNRLTRIDYPSGTDTVYEYDGGPSGAPNAIGRLTKITDESGSTSYSYDGFGHVTSKTQVVNSAAGSRSFTVATQWGESGISTGKPVLITYPSGASVEIGYEKNGQSCAGRPCFITVTRSSRTSVLLENLEYNALHALAGWTWGDGTTYQRTFDSFARLKTYPLGNPAGSGNAMGMTRTLQYDDAGRITGYSHSGGQAALDQIHSYDGLDRLTGTQKNATSYGYGYDATGNRTQRLIGGVSYTHTVQGSSSRLASVQEPSGSGTATRTYSYDNAGNLTYDGVNTFIYGDRGRMSRADTPNGSVSYLINGLEQRVSKTGLTVPSGAVYYVYDEAGHTIGEYDTNGNAVYEVVYLGDTPVGVITASSISYVYADHIDTPRVIARNSDHAVVWRWDEAEAFGATPPNEDPSGLGSFTFNQRFPGQVFDRETGLSYNWHRDYSASTGRYVQSDPIGILGGINTYAYVNGNPLNNIDPLGLAPFDSDAWTQSQLGQISTQTNCYGYALDKVGYGNPGDSSLFPRATCERLMDNAKSDGLIESNQSNQCGGDCPSGYHKVQIFLDDTNMFDRDYHVYRQDDDSGWSHKRGRSGKPERNDAKGQVLICPINSARTYGDRDYKKYCGTLCARETGLTKNLREWLR